MTDSSSVKERIDASWSELSALADALGPGGLTVSGPDGWAVKDHLAHVAAWERWLIALFAKEDRLAAMGLAPGFKGDVDAINAALWARHHELSAAAALAYFRDTHAELMSMLGRYSDADLELPYSHYATKAADDPDRERPISLWVAANTYEHYAEHVGWIRSLTAEGS